MIRVEVSRQNKKLRVDDASLSRLVRMVLKAESVAVAQISIAIVDDVTIHRVNRDHLGHDYPTDVVTFPLSSPGESLSGEIVVSADHARSNAVEYGHSAIEELFLYVIHGVLHLTGYDDRRSADARRMSERQDELLAKWMSNQRIHVRRKRRKAGKVEMDRRGGAPGAGRKPKRP